MYKRSTDVKIKHKFRSRPMSSIVYILVIMINDKTCYSKYSCIISSNITDRSMTNLSYVDDI